MAKGSRCSVVNYDGASSSLLGGAATALPLTVLAQQQMPLVGFLNSASPDTYRFNADSFREGLTKGGFVEGRNLRIEERWARSDYDALPALAAELVAMGVVAIAATGDVASARAAQRASSTVLSRLAATRSGLDSSRV